MKRGLFVLACFLLLVLPVVNAVETVITVKTLPNHQLNIFVLDSSQTYYLLKSFMNRDSGSAGEVVVRVDSNVSEIDVNVIVKKDGTSVDSKKFEGFSAGQPINIEFPEIEELVKPEEEQNTTVEEEPIAEEIIESPASEVIDEEANDAKVEITGNIIGEDSKGKSNWVYYAVASVILTALIVFVVFKILLYN